MKDVLINGIPCKRPWNFSFKIPMLISQKCASLVMVCCILGASQVIIFWLLFQAYPPGVGRWDFLFVEFRRIFRADVSFREIKWSKWETSMKPTCYKKKSASFFLKDGNTIKPWGFFKFWETIICGLDFCGENMTARILKKVKSSKDWHFFISEIW